jgi:predicted O-linked N-acetylglucosamine transferase (SPINDLY family)
LTDQELAKQIMDDAIDILIDLSGHTALNRLRTFARKPAPIQVSWLGYPGTTGLHAMDYYLVDRHWLPVGQFDEQFTEKLVYLPSSASFHPHSSAPPVNVLPALATGRFTFGSFNRLGKINDATIRSWAQLLRALPEARMLLGGIPLIQQGQLVQKFAAEEISPGRLTLHPRGSMGAYLALHGQVDLCLDTHPYTGGTTTNHALWMGVPTITIVGSTPAGRQSAAFLSHVGLHAFVAADVADFVAKGVYWANHLGALANTRQEARERFRQSLLLNPDAIVAGLDGALRHMWRRWCAGQSAESFQVIGPEIIS